MAAGPLDANPEQLAQVGEWVARVAGAIERLADNLGTRVSTLEAEQAELRDEIHAVANRLESVTRAVGELNARANE